MNSNFILYDHPLLVIMGTSGSGKSRLVQHLESSGIIELTRSWTTRPPRPGEANGKSEHIHVSPQVFADKLDQNYFLETVQLFNLPYYYGMPKIELNDQTKIPCVIVRVSTLPLLQKHYGNYIIYQIETSKQLAIARLKKRGDSQAEIVSRLKLFDEEIQQGRKLANQIFQYSPALYKRVSTSIAKKFSQ